MKARGLKLTLAASLRVAASLSVLTCLFLFTAASASAGIIQFGTAGTGSGQTKDPFGIGIDDATQNVYVADLLNGRIDQFGTAGNFIQAWGWDVDEAAPAQELQTCITFCQAGESGRGAGEYAGSGPQGLAVDNDPLSASYGDVYVVDWENYRVEKFSPTGDFLLAFGSGVNETTAGDVCVAGERCTAGAPGTGNGQFEWSYRSSYIAVGPGGAVYVGDRARVQVFEPSGVWRENISLAKLSSTGQVTALAVDGSGDVYVKDSEVPGVHELEPSGTEIAGQLDAGSETVEALATDGAGDLFVADSSGGVRVLEYNRAGNQIAQFGSDAAYHVAGMAFANGPGELFLTVNGEEGLKALYGVSVLTPPKGPLVEEGGESAMPGQRGAATLRAIVDPEGQEITHRFEYVTEAQFKQSGYASASSTPAVATGSSFDDQALSAEVTGLQPGAGYHFRVVVTSSKGTSVGPDETFAEVPPALVEGPWATNVAATSATLAARIDPLGASTEYRFEYGTSAAYGQSITGNIGEGASYIPIDYHSQALLPDTTYHYRLVTTNEVGTTASVDHTFTTQSSGHELELADGRAWQMVSPPNKAGALIGDEYYAGDLTQAAADGSAISYVANAPFGEKEEGHGGRIGWSQVLSARQGTAWHTKDISIPYAAPPSKEELIVLSDTAASDYRAFSPNLSEAIIEPFELRRFSLSPEAPERSIYLRDNEDGVYTPLVNENNVPPGTKYGGRIIGTQSTEMKTLVATPDLKHTIIASPEALTPEAAPPECEVLGCGSGPAPFHLFEWGEGKLQPVNILPDGQPEQSYVDLAPLIDTPLPHAISNDGRWVVWSTNAENPPYALYIRDMMMKTTVRVGGPAARFQTMSTDGARIFYLERGDLYEFETSTGTQTDLTADHGPAESAGVKETLLGTSEDGSYVYFVATRALVGAAVDGSDNLYLLHDGASGWATTYIATLSGEDESDWFSGNGKTVNLTGVTSRVSPSGRYLAFMSSISLSGYDNRDAASGQPDEQAYLYDAVGGRLVCASCNPTGARPVGQLEAAPPYGHAARTVAARVPGWRSAFINWYQPRYLSDSGRLFFESADALVPQDTNGTFDVYEYEPPGIGSCTAASSAFSERSGGCVALLSSGTSSEESRFFDASENGDDAFFATASPLSSADYDDSMDVYDAHVCTAAAPCESAPVSPPQCTTGDSCKVAPSSQPETFGSPSSETFSGAGNVPAQAGSLGSSSSKKKSAKKKSAKKKHKAKQRKARRRTSGGRRKPAARSRAGRRSTSRRGLR